ncbi:MFS transporter [Corynebacterium pseudodiphtheriticum]|uniref:MFS transporter n=1 Tax=Corynebacterium pseudodiphtheriticum TaxID=37637 RepID=UPI0020C02E2B|nr:MFS transporter [Corynebacterium pseudodiphtheriticum]UQV58871.1 MFS transporter [Corynebacterium pseudodiphtheriticum]
MNPGSPRTARNQQHNGRHIAIANALQNIGDQTASAKTVLPWLFTAAGVPAAFSGLLVPVRESLAMLPQAALRGWVTSQESRKRIWILGSLGQALCAALMALAALVLSGTSLGVTIVVLLACLAICRSLSSLSGKDVLGRAVSKGQRGAVTGTATTLSGIVTIAVGGVLLFVPSPIPIWVGAVLIGIGALGWCVAALSFARVDENLDTRSRNKAMQPELPGDALPTDALPWYRDTWQLLRDDAHFRQFVVVRSLLLVSSLSTAFIVTLSALNDSSFAELGAFVFVSGLSALLAGRISGIWSDRSSRTVMSVAAGTASLVLLLLVASSLTLPPGWNSVLFPLGFFLVSLSHAAIRVARSTYLVDMAEDDQRTRYTGAANTLMGVILLCVGASSSVIALKGPAWALVFLSLIGFVGVWAARKLPEVSQGG